MYIHQISAEKYVKQKLIELKVEIHKCTIIFGDFNTSFSRTGVKQPGKKLEVLTNAIKQDKQIKDTKINKKTTCFSSFSNLYTFISLTCPTTKARISLCWVKVVKADINILFSVLGNYAVFFFFYIKCNIIIKVFHCCCLFVEVLYQIWECLFYY